MPSGTFPLDCFGLSFSVGLWIEMVMTLCLSEMNARVCIIHRKWSLMNTLGVKFGYNSNRFMTWLGQAHDGKSPVQQVESWEHLNLIADSNHVGRSAITFDDGTIELCDVAWGKPT